jgi:hypothetical protein
VRSSASVATEIVAAGASAGSSAAANTAVRRAPVKARPRVACCAVLRADPVFCIRRAAAGYAVSRFDNVMSSLPSPVSFNGYRVDMPLPPTGSSCKALRCCKAIERGRLRFRLSLRRPCSALAADRRHPLTTNTSEWPVAASREVALVRAIEEWIAGTSPRRDTRGHALPGVARNWSNDGFAAPCAPG